MSHVGHADRGNWKSRREFLKLGTAAAVAASLPIARAAHAAGSDVIRLAFIGCGGRGTGAASQALATAGPVKLVAMANVFAERIEQPAAVALDRGPPRPHRRAAGTPFYGL